MDTAIARAPAARRAVFEDGLGKRYTAVGPGGEPLEVLALREELTAAPSFEFSLRERVGALTAFQNTAFARIRGVQRLGQETSSLAVMSDRVSGPRLSDVLAVADQHLLPLEINAALYLVRQLVHAVATLHEQMPAVAHGALAPERIIITSNAALVIVEHVLATALEQLHLSHELCWKELGIAMPHGTGVPRFDQRADILQVGTVALALIVGRPLYREEYPDKIAALAERAWGLTATGGVEPLPAAVRTWLSRALQLDARQSFASAVEARAELDRAFGGSDPGAPHRTLKSFLAEYAKHATPTGPATDATPMAVAVAPAQAVAPPFPASAAVSVPGQTPARGEAHPPPRSSSMATPPPTAIPIVPIGAATDAPPPPVAHAKTPVPPAAAAAHSPTAAAPRPPASSSPVWPAQAPTPAPSAKPRATTQVLVEQEAEADMTNSTPWWRRRWIAAAVLLVALAGGGALAGRWYVMPPAAAEAAGTLVVNTNPDGVAVVIDGQPRGFTPLTLTLTPGAHTLELLADGEPRTIPLAITAGGTMSQFIELPKPGAVTGQLQVRTEPSGARVTVDGVARGVAPLMVEGLTPGAHTVVLASDLGSVTHAVTVEAGATASLVAPMTAPQGGPLSGWIAVAAPADVQVYENDRLLGSSRSDRIMVSVGRHELEVVNEALGYRTTRTVNVSPGQVAPVRLDWPKGALAINAQPWAEVWIDGERLGETPIGNVAVPIGPHDVVFRHPEFGEQVVRTTVTLTAPARLSVDLRKR
jgi:hypothetical protein